MGNTIRDLAVLRLTSHAAFEAFEVDVTLDAPGSLRVIFAHKRNELRQFVDNDPFEDLPTVVIPSKNTGNNGSEAVVGDGMRHLGVKVRFVMGHLA